MNLSRYEQETVVNYNAGEQTAPKSHNLLLAEDLVTRKPRTVSTEQRDTGKVMEHHFGR